VTTDIANTAPADAYTGATLLAGPNSFRITGSQAGTPLRVRVEHLGLTYNTGTVAVTNGSAVVTGTGTSWHAGMAGLRLQVSGDAAVYAILSVDGATRLTLRTLFAGATAAGQAYTIFETRPPASGPMSVVLPEHYAEGSVAVTSGSTVVTGTGTRWHAALAGLVFRVEGDAARYQVQAVNSATELVLDRNYPGSSVAGKIYAIQFPLYTDYRVATNWQERYYVVGFKEHVQVTTDAAGRPLRKYEVLLPAPGDAFRGGVPLTTSLAEPIAYAQVSVSTADDKPHAADAPKWAAGRWGNRFGNEGDVGATATIFRVRREPPPAPPLPPDAERVFATPADYHGRSYYTYRWRLPAANWKAHIFRALDDAVFRTDWSQRPRPALAASQLEFFPDPTVEPRWDEVKRGQVAEELNHLNSLTDKALALAYYRGLSNDGLRVLAGLPGNEQGFTQLTIQPLNPADPINADRRGPDSPDTYTPDPALRACVDTLDGRATNRYFYRAAYVDGAHNRSQLSLSSPPIWLPDIFPPTAPRLLKVLGGDRRVTLHWGEHREPAMRRYLIYRTESLENGRDIRLMGPPVANLPARLLVAHGGEVDLDAGTDIAIAERVYAAADFDPSLDLLTGQTAAQYLTAPTPPTGSRVTGLTAPDGTAVVVVYRDSRQGLQHTPQGNAPRGWTDQGLVGAHTYYYRIVATREGETTSGPLTIHSPPSELGRGRAVDLTPPKPPTITTIEWVRVGEDGTIFPYAAPVPPDEVRRPAVHLVWTSPDSELTSLVQFRIAPGGDYANASKWLPRGTYEYVHRNEFGFQEQSYRLKVMNSAGNANTSYAPASLAATI
jgi:hypothetical protein